MNGQFGQAAANPQLQGALQASLSRKVWVILPDYGTEGLKEPIAAYQSQIEADKAMKLLGHAMGTFKCVAIELW